MTPPRAPTAAELLADLIVLTALEQAWIDSDPNDPLNRHEEGGWIYIDLNSGSLRVERASRGHGASIDLSKPPRMGGFVVIAKFHTHPNPSSEGWATGPSSSDTIVDAQHGVPDLIRAEDGVHMSGPASRRGGLSGPAGFPD